MQPTNKGFTLIEMLVATAIFTVVMVIALGALLAMSESDRKAQSLKSVINNLDFAVDSMSRAIRTGTGYGCASGQTPQSQFCFTDSNGKSVSYCFSQNGTSCLSAATVACPALKSCSLLRSSDGGSTYLPLTSPEVKITNLIFYLFNVASYQPRVILLMSGYVQVTATQKSEFNLQTSVTQRVFDQQQ